MDAMSMNVQRGDAPDEIFDVVNERDEIVGQATRREVHARGLRHRAVHVLVFNAAGQIFLQKRSMKKDASPGCWDSSCSGHVAAGEDYDATVVRELNEEIGLRVPAAPPRWFRVEACADTGEEFVWAYRLQAEGPFQPNPDEIERAAWFVPTEVTAWMKAKPGEFAPAFRLIWKMARAKIEGSFQN
ncbi:MAG: NUDIX domain-containing protein [Verrucomicrobiota bacterium]|nr:NUDIX domain-containing protein [Verrucomicrobiota bacterium]